MTRFFPKSPAPKDPGDYQKKPHEGITAKCQEACNENATSGYLSLFAPAFNPSLSLRGRWDFECPGVWLEREENITISSEAFDPMVCSGLGKFAVPCYFYERWLQVWREKNKNIDALTSLEQKEEERCESQTHTAMTI